MTLLELIPLGVLLLPMTWLFITVRSMQADLRDTYSKGEAKEMMDLKNKPIEAAIERNTEVNRELATAIRELQKELSRLQKD